jgi:hypothetical protein
MKKWAIRKVPGNCWTRLCAKEAFPNSNSPEKCLLHFRGGFEQFVAAVTHPVVRLVVWGVAAVGTQFAAGAALVVVSVLVATATLWVAPVRFGRLLRRTRWLMLAIAILFAWSTPGVLFLPGIPELSPSIDGVILGATHLARLIVLLASLALLLESTPAAELVGALFSLLAPLRLLRIDRYRIAVRLLLVMDYAESAAPLTWRSWLEPSALRSEPYAVMLHQAPLRMRDHVALGAAAILGGLFVFMT